MKLKFITPQTAERNLRATAHKTGKLGFTIEAAKKLELSVEKSAGIAINEENLDDKSLYLILYPDRREGAFNVHKAGDYYYLNTKTLFDSLGIDYQHDFVSYDISAQVIDNEQMYVLKRRDKVKQTKLI